MSEKWKVGDLVAYRGGLPERWHIHRVERITPSGLLCLAGCNTKLRSHLESLLEVGDSRSWPRGYWMRATPEIRRQAAKERLIDRLGACEWSKLPLETLLAVDDIVKQAVREVTPRVLR